MNDCKHEITNTEWYDGEWSTVNPNYWIDGEWVEEIFSTFEDIDLHRYRCIQCGTVGYYSEAARNFFENGIECDISGLNNETQNMNKITVTVSGRSGSGKSTIASVIATALGKEDIKFDVDLVDGKLPNVEITEVRLDSIKERGLHVDIVERSTAPSSRKNDDNILPWQRGVLKHWSICGMNHYHINGVKFIYVSMTRGTNCVTMEGPDNEQLWNRLESNAQQHYKK